MKYPMLEQIQSPSDLSAFSEQDMTALADEIRSFLVESVTETGGHLASNLGVVELMLALHRTFDFSTDRLILDVGHQCYVHKLLTGRREQFSSLRRVNGLSGFPKPSESVYDAFGTGHSSTSLSAALGFSEAAYLKGSDAYTVAVIGDGAFTGGMIHEALNNVKRDRRLILILNENEMSISRNIGRFAEHIARIRASERYYRTKNRTAGVISSIPLVGGVLFRFVRFLKQKLKDLMYGSNLFEQLGLYYLGPVDGNDYARVRLLLKEAVSYGRSAVIHLHTTKGKGYRPAEENPSAYHGIPPKRRETSGNARCFSHAMGEALCARAASDPHICAVTAAMGDATGLEAFAASFPDRFFDVGIAEPHALTFCAGLSCAGMRPVFAVYSSFLQRGFDNLIHDIALQGLSVTICVDRAGLSGGDGPTHHGIFDVAMLSPLKGARIYAPATFGALEAALVESMERGGLCAIRYPNSGALAGEEMAAAHSDDPLSILLESCPDRKQARWILTYGRLLKEARIAADEMGDCGVMVLQRLAPYDESADEILACLPECAKQLLIAEEGIESGGAALALRDRLGKEAEKRGIALSVLAIVDPFAPKKGENDLYEAYGIGKSAMKEAFARMDEKKAP